MGAFFVLLCCNPALYAERVTAVFDGDTIKLENQEIIRLIGIDAPELGRKGKPGEPYAKASKKRLAELIRDSGFEVQLDYDEQQEDKYQRTLAYLRLNNGEDPARILLREGLATILVIPPNTARTDDYASLEETARQKWLKIWSRPGKQAVSAAELSGKESGYHRVQGVVSSLRSSRYVHWIRLDNKLTIKLTRSDAKRYFPPGLIDELPGRQIEVRGKLYRYRNQQRMRLRHLASIDLLR